MSDKGREAVFQIIKDALGEGAHDPNELSSKLELYENHLLGHGWHHEDDLDKCRHFHLTENHGGRLKCCYIGGPVCKIRNMVCAMLISRRTR